ncbi:FAD-binding domain-containing protein [Xylariaceae sp. FL1019]|nr:FAD-binding domain-containing protein [Xylariaceae sp. FL1019]
MSTKISAEVLEDLISKVGEDAEIVSDTDNDRFQSLAKRLSDVDRRTPAAIVQWTRQNSVPFLAKSGGQSEWSTIGEDGIVINLSKYSTISYFLGIGASITTSITGYGSDQILSARMITAAGPIVNITEDEQPELLCNQRFRALSNCWLHDGWISSPKRIPLVTIAARLTGDPEFASIAFKVLIDLQPILHKGGAVPIQNVNDGREAFEAKDEFKRFGVVGLRRYNIQSFLGTCPDAVNTSFNFQWDLRPPRAPGFESANSLHDIRLWQNNFIWHISAAIRELVDELSEQSITLMRGSETGEYADFQNGTRTGPIQWRFRGMGNLEKLTSPRRNGILLVSLRNSCFRKM